MYQKWLPVGLAALRAHSMPWRSISGRLPHPLSPGPHNISERYLPSGLGAWALGRGRRPGLRSCLSLDLPWICLFLLIPSSMSASSPLPARLPQRLLTAPHPAHRAPGSVSAGACANHSWSCLHGLPSSLTFPTCAALNAIHLSLVVSFLSHCLFALPSVSVLKAQNNRQLYVHKKCTREVMRSWYKVPLTSVSTQSIPSPEATTIYGFVRMHA